MNAPVSLSLMQSRIWQWPVDSTKYGHTLLVSEAERAALNRPFSIELHQSELPVLKRQLHRLLLPIEDVLTFLKGGPEYLL